MGKGNIGGRGGADAASVMIDRKCRLTQAEVAESLFFELVEGLRGDEEASVGEVLAEIEKCKEGVQRKIFLQLRERGFSVLHIAVRFASFPLVASMTDKVLSFRGDIDVRDAESGWTPLHLACYLRKPLAAVHLLLCGADMYRKDHDENLPLDFLSSYNPNPALGHAERCRAVAAIGGSLLVAGSNVYYQIGAGDNEVNLSVRGLTVDGLRGACMAATGRKHSLFLDAEGRVFAVGSGEGGRLGLADEATRTEAQTVDRLPPIKLVAASETRSAAISRKGGIYEWGQGQLEPRRVPGLPSALRFDRVALGEDYTLAVDAQGVLWGWGSNRSDQLALGDVVPGAPTPRHLPTFEGIRTESVFVLEDGISAAVTRTGEVYTWGAGIGRPRKTLLIYRPKGSVVKSRSLDLMDSWMSERESAVGVTSAGGMLFALTRSGRVYSWRPGDMSAKRSTAFGRRTITDIQGRGVRLLALDSFGGIMELRPSRSSRDAATHVGHRGVVAMAVGCEHAIFVMSSGFGRASDSVDASAAAEAESAPQDGPPQWSAATSDETATPESSLESLCAAALARSLTTDNALEVVDLAVMVNNDGLYAACVEFVEANLDQIVWGQRGASPVQHWRALQALNASFGGVEGGRRVPAVDAPYPEVPYPELPCPEDPCPEAPRPNSSPAEASVSAADSERRFRAVRKKLQKIEVLEARSASGKRLSDEECRKVRHKEALMDELAAFLARGFSAEPSPGGSQAGSPAPSPATSPAPPPPMCSGAGSGAGAGTGTVRDWADEEPGDAPAEPGPEPGPEPAKKRHRRRANKQQKKQQPAPVQQPQPPPPANRARTAAARGGEVDVESQDTWRTGRPTVAAVGRWEAPATAEYPALGSADAACVARRGSAPSGAHKPAPASAHGTPAAGVPRSRSAPSGGLERPLAAVRTTSTGVVHHFSGDGKSQRKKKSTLLQVGSFPAPASGHSASHRRSDQAAAAGAPQPSAEPRRNPWAKVPDDRSGGGGGGGLVNIQQEEEERRCAEVVADGPRRGAAASRFATSEPVDDAEDSFLAGYLQTRAKTAPPPPAKKWDKEMEDAARPNLKNILTEETVKAERLRRGVCGGPPANSCWMRLPSDEPLPVKSLRKIEVEERAMKAIHQHMNGAVIVRRVGSSS